MSSPGTYSSEDVFNFLVAYIDQHGYPPTVRDIAEAIGTVPSNVRRYLQMLESDGLIERTPGVSRGIKLLQRVY